MDEPCTCLDHRDTDVAVRIGEHAFTREEDYETSARFGYWRWRWVCSCGHRGRWQAQSDNVAYHSWLRHVEKSP